MTRRLLVALFLGGVAATTLSAAGWAAGDAEGLSEAAVASYEVRWVERRAEKTFDGRLDEAASKPYALDLVQENLTRVDFVLSWVETEDSLGTTQDDTFRLEAAAPDGAVVAGSPARGAGSVLVLRSGALNPLPEPMSVDADGLDRLADASSSLGQGTWRVTVTLESAGNPGGQKLDRGNTYVLTLVLRWYEATVLKSVSLEPPRTLGPGGLSASTWEWVTYGLGGASVLLGGLVLFDRKRP